MSTKEKSQVSIDEEEAEQSESFENDVPQIFVGGISPLVTESELQAEIGKIGSYLECRLIIDKDTHKSRGFGFATFASE